MNAKITWLCRKPQERNLVLVLQVWFRNGNQHIQYTSCHVVAHMWLLIVLSPLLPYNLQFLMCIYWLWKSASFWILWFLPSPLSELGLFATVLLRFSFWFVLIGTWVLHTFFLLLSRSVCWLIYVMWQAFLRPLLWRPLCSQLVFIVIRWGDLKEDMDSTRSPFTLQIVWVFCLCIMCAARASLGRVWEGQTGHPFSGTGARVGCHVDSGKWTLALQENNTCSDHRLDHPFSLNPAFLFYLVSLDSISATHIWKGHLENYVKF